MTRRRLDAYQSSLWMPRALATHAPEICEDSRGGYIFEPCVGRGAIANVLHDEFGRRVVTNDADIGIEADHHGDASDERIWLNVSEFRLTQRPAWVVSNTPWAMPISMRILMLAMTYATHGVAMLYRVTFLEPTAHVHPRGPFLRDYPPDRVLVLPRYSFTQDGQSDTATAAWFVWSRVPGRVLSGPPILSLYHADEEFANPRTP